MTRILKTLQSACHGGWDLYILLLTREPALLVSCIPAAPELDAEASINSCLPLISERLQFFLTARSWACTHLIQKVQITLAPRREAAAPGHALRLISHGGVDHPISELRAFKGQARHLVSGITGAAGVDNEPA